jgi:phage terminase large subunit-like protein
MPKVPQKWMRNESDLVAVEQGCFFDQSKADHICDFFETFLSVSTGRLAGKPLKLLPWQRDFLSRLNGWRSSDGERRFRRAFVGISKKCGKTFLNSGLALYFGLADGDIQPEVVMAASSREQATICFRESKNMIMASPAIKKICNVVDSRKRIELPSASGYIAVISSDSKRSEGINASLIICDESHCWYGRELYEALEYAGVARANSLLIETTTAGTDKGSFCYENWVMAQKVIRGDVIDVTLLPIVYTAEGLDFDDPKSWHMANPSLGTVLSEDDFRDALNKAKQSPIKWQSFQRYRLGIWVDSAKAWLDMERWGQCETTISKDSLVGKKCFGGLDLSHKKDLTAFVLYFPEDNAFLCWAWTTSYQVNLRSQKNKASYLQFIEDGELEALDGEIIEHAFVREKILELSNIYDIETIGYDPYSAQQICVELEGEGIDMASFRQGFVSMSEPTKAFEALVLQKKIQHFDSRLLRWTASNVCVSEDPAGNIKADKSKSHEMIDPIICAIMALGIAGVSTPTGPSVYESRGILSF